MALIRCPECGKEISDKAMSCPNCGCPIAAANNNESIVSSKVGSVTKYNNWISLVAAIVLIIGFNLSFFQTNEKPSVVLDISKGKIGEWVSTLKSINEVERGIDFISDAVGESQRIRNNSFDTAITVGSITLFFLVIAVIVLIVNCFKPLKTGPILVGIIGIILLIILTASLMSSLNEKYGVHGNADVGFFALGIGFLIGVFSDYDLQKKLKIVKGRDEGESQIDRKKKTKVVDPKTAINNDLINAAFLMNEVEFLIKENIMTIGKELPEIYGKNVPLLAVFPDGRVKSKTDNEMEPKVPSFYTKDYVGAGTFIIP